MFCEDDDGNLCIFKGLYEDYEEDFDDDGLEIPISPYLEGEELDPTEHCFLLLHKGTKRVPEALSSLFLSFNLLCDDDLLVVCDDLLATLLSLNCCDHLLPNLCSQVRDIPMSPLYDDDFLVICDDLLPILLSLICCDNLLSNLCS